MPSLISSSGSTHLSSDCHEATRAGYEAVGALEDIIRTQDPDDLTTIPQVSASFNHGFEVRKTVDRQEQTSLTNPAKRKERDEEVTGPTTKRRSLTAVPDPASVIQLDGLKHENHGPSSVSDAAAALVYAQAPRSAVKVATRDDEEMAASALVSMYDDTLQDDHDEEHEPGGSMALKKRKDSRSSTTMLKRSSAKAKNKTITSLCYECGTEQTSHFRPVVSDFIGKKSKTSENYPRVEVCNKCYCKMAPKLDEYPAWRLGMLKKQIGLYAEHGVTHFDVCRDAVSSRKNENETLSFLGSLQIQTRSGGTVGALKVRPVIIEAARQ